jgi:Sec-independent protein secretion pathway component TatC
MALLAVPMYVLYELSIWVIVPLERRWSFDKLRMTK